MIVYYYIYYRFLSFADLYLKTEHIGEPIYFFSMILLSAYESIIIFLSFDISNSQHGMILTLILMVINYFLLVHNDKGIKIEERFSKEKRYFKVIGDIMVILLFVLLIFMF